MNDTLVVYAKGREGSMCWDQDQQKMGNPSRGRGGYFLFCFWIKVVVKMRKRRGGVSGGVDEGKRQLGQRSRGREKDWRERERERGKWEGREKQKKKGSLVIIRTRIIYAAAPTPLFLFTLCHP